jgi:sialic acid synthase SpsE
MVKIIAEAGTNHNGNINLAYKLVDVAKNSGADFVKFQIINPESLYVPFYWENKKKIKSIVFERRKEESLTNDEWQKICKYCKKKGIAFTASVFDTAGVDFLKQLKVPFIKLASSDLNNKSLIQYVAKQKIPLIISSGMASLSEVKKSIEAFCEFNSKSQIKVLHCVSVYPCELQNTSLHKIKMFQNELDCEIGFSDHTLNSKAACIATSLGVSFIEKHFTLNKEMDGFDHKYASSPEEFDEYIKNIRSMEKSLNENLNTSSAELVTKVRARRGVYLNKALKKGDVITLEDLVSLRPSNKINPFEMDKLIGLHLGEDIKEFEPIELIDEKIFSDLNSVWKTANEYWKQEMKEKKMIK